MPKNKKKLKTNKAGSTKGRGSDEDVASDQDDTASTISNASTNMSYQEGLDLNEESNKFKLEDQQTFNIDNLDQQIGTALDGLNEKGFKEREEALKSLSKLFKHKMVTEHLANNRFTLIEALLKCLKRGKQLSEQLLAGETLQLAFLQQYGDIASSLGDCRATLLEIIDDNQAEPEVRAVCVKTLGLGIFVANESPADVVPVLDKLENIFSQSYAKGDGTFRSFTPKQLELHATALSVWSLLVTIVTPSTLNKLIAKNVPHFVEIFKSSDVDLRIVAGETIAILFELAQCDSHIDLACFEDDALIQALHSLASDSSKHRSKRDRKHQRHSFRDILHTVEEGRDFDAQTVKFGGTESLVLDNWMRRKQYETFRDVFGTGLNTHLQENEYLRDMFDLGAPLLNNDPSRRSQLNSMSHFQKTQFNKEQFRNRTKNMNKKREKKADVGDEHDDE